MLLAACHKDDDDEQQAPETTAANVKVGDTVPDFILEGVDGDVKSSSLQGKVFMITFFDTGCPDCRNEFPILQQIYDKYKDVVPMFHVPRSQPIETVNEYWAKEGLTLPVCTAPGLYYKFAEKTIPRTYIVDREGVVRAIYTDSPIADFNTLDTMLTQVLAEGQSREAKSVDVSFRVKVPVTRANDEYYFQNEYTVSHLDVFFFDAETKKFVTKASIENLSRDDDYYDTQYDITYIVQAQRIVVGVYNIFAIANFDYCPETIEDQDTFLNMVDSVTYAKGIEPYIPSRGPVMTSRPMAMLAIDLVPWAGKSLSIAIEMERVMAKLQIGVSQEYFELNYNGTKYADIKITNYKFVNLIKQYYLFQHTDILTTLGSKPTFSFPDHFQDYTNQDNQYVVDPLFYQKKPDKAYAMKIGNCYASWFGDYTTKDFASIVAANNYGHAYILENTSFKDDQKDGYSAGIVFKASVSPVFAYLYDQKTHTLVKENRPEYWSDVIYVYNHNFYGSIQAVNLASGLTLDELETYTDSQLKPYGIKQCKFNMGVYETYYTYWIRHRSDSTDPMGPMCYGIVRNNFYKITVTGISGIGNSEIVSDVMRDNYPNSYVDVEVN